MKIMKITTQYISRETIYRGSEVSLSHLFCGKSAFVLDF